MKGSQPLRINLLGPLEIHRGKQPVELPASKKARALLAYLIANTRKHRRDRLTELLWDVADDPKGGLRWCLTKIRPLVDDPQRSRILADRETVEFRPEDAQVDLYVLRQRLQGGRSTVPKDLQDLAAMFRGSFLEGLDLPDFVSFQMWLVAAREDVRQQHVSILRAIAHKLSDNPDAAVPYARLLVEIDPLDENSRAQLSGFLVKLGRQSEAKQITVTGTRLVRELGAEVSRELSQPVAMPILEAQGERGDWATLTPLVGRTDECARLRTALENART